MSSRFLSQWQKTTHTKLIMKTEINCPFISLRSEGNDRYEQSHGPSENSENHAGVHKTERKNGYDRGNE